MAVTVNSNLAALRVQRALATSTSSLQKNFERLSSGLRINRASDDAAGLAIASSLNTDSRVFSQAIRNVNDTLSYYNIASGGLSELSNITQRLIELAEQASNGVYSNANRLAADKEAGALIQEFNRITATTSFNGASLLAGTSNQLQVQAGFGTINFAVTDQIERYKGGFSLATKTGLAVGGMVSGVVGEYNDTVPVIGGTNYVDLAYCSAGLAVNVAYGNGDGTFANDLILMTTVLAKGLAGGDFNNDGYRDLVVRDSAGSYQISLGTVSGAGNFAAAQAAGVANMNDVQVGDFNGDGRDDFVVVSTAGTARAFISNGNGTFTGGTAFSTGRGSGAYVAVGDFNGDGTDDIALTSNSFVDVYTGQGNGNFSTTAYTSIATASSLALQAADFNGDGYDDLAVGTAGALKTYQNNRAGSFDAATSYVTSGIALTTGDFDGDGIIDIASRQHIFKGSRDGTFSNTVGHQIAGSGYLQMVDLNADGVNDLVGESGGDAGAHLQASTLTTEIKNQFLSTRASSLSALTYFKQVLANINKEQGATGANLSRLESVTNVFLQSRENYIAAASRITDVDVAEESANLVRNRILQQAGAALLTQANQQPALAIQLLRGR